MTKLLVLPLAIVAGLLTAAAPARAAQGTEQLLGAYNFLLDGGDRPVGLPHCDTARSR